jgi:2-methylisocitrate lyase-like PEP mutase family enzyme
MRNIALFADPDQPILIPGCHDALSARTAAATDAEIVFLAGSATGTALFGAAGIPPEGAATYLQHAQIVCSCSPVPLMVDIEDGFDDPLSVGVDLRRAGAVGVLIGDGRRDGTLQDAEEFASVVRTLRDLGLLVAARTDGLAADRPDTMRRLDIYRAAGAELTLALLTDVHAIETPEQKLRTYSQLASAAGGTLALHARRRDELPPISQLPRGVRALLVTGISIPL